MKNRSNALLALSLTLALVTAIRAAGDRPMETPYYPLQVGSVWYYRVGEVKVTMTVAKYEEFDKQLCARVETMSPASSAAFVTHVAVRDDGVYRFDFANSKVDPPVRFFRLPPAKNLTWDVKSMMGTESLAGTFKIGRVAEVTVAAGTYKDVFTSTGDFEASGKKITFTYYFARDVGMVKQVVNMGDREVVVELEKFEPGK